MGTIEFHGWGSLASDVEKPDRMVLDLDPDEGLDFDMVRKAAMDMKRHLSDLGLVSFPMLTGGKGVHVVVPLTPQAEWPLVTDFTKRFATALSEAEPERFTATMSKRSEEHTSELPSLMRISYAVFCFKKKTTTDIRP